MNKEEFTDEEKAVVARLLHRKPSAREALSDYAIYIIPSLAFAIYSTWAHDFVAALVAYGSLLFVAVWYLSYSQKVSRPLFSALQKYEKHSNKLAEYEKLSK